MTIWHSAAHFFGTDNLGGPYYGFWSGVGGDLSVLAVLAVVYRKLNCHSRRCWRIGLHKVDGTPYVVCRKHHPGVPDKVTAEHIKRKYQGAK